MNEKEELKFELEKVAFIFMKSFFTRNLKIIQCIVCEEDSCKYQKVLPLNTLFNHIPVVQDNSISNSESCMMNI